MSWSYDETNLDTETSAGRINVVRFLIGDTDTNDQLVQNEEITFALGQSSENVYYGAAFCANTLAAKFARLVDTELDGALSSKYSGLYKKFRGLSLQLKQDAVRQSGRAFNVYAGGINIPTIESVRKDRNRPSSSFKVDMFRNGIDPDEDYYNDDSY